MFSEIFNNFNQNSIKIFNNFNRDYESKREELIDFLYRTYKYLKLSDFTFFSTIQILDKLFIGNKESFSIENLYEIAIAALYLSIKFNEINIPKKKDILDSYYILNNKNYTNKFIDLYEILILKILDYKLNYTSVYDYIMFFFDNYQIFFYNYLSNKLFNKEKLLNLIKENLLKFIKKFYKFNSLFLAIYLIKLSFQILYHNECNFVECIEKILKINIKNSEEFYLINKKFIEIKNEEILYKRNLIFFNYQQEQFQLMMLRQNLYKINLNNTTKM
jgi:hypothetical protein